MKHTTKTIGSRFAALLLCLCMVFTMVPSAYAAEVEDDLIVGFFLVGVFMGYFGAGGVIVIP